MNRNFDRSLLLVLKHEGGFVDHPSDPGGATNKGITIGTFRQYVKKNGTVADLKAMTTAQAGIVYKKQYWDTVKGDDLPDGVDYAVFDFAVNSGHSRAIKYLQATVGVVQDGDIGPATFAAINKASNVEIVEVLCDKRLAFLKRLSTWKTFGKGWGSRVSSVRSTAITMVSSNRVPVTPQKPTPDPVTGLFPGQTVKESAPVSAAGFWAGIASLIKRLFGN